MLNACCCYVQQLYANFFCLPFGTEPVVCKFIRAFLLKKQTAATADNEFDESGESESKQYKFNQNNEL